MWIPKHSTSQFSATEGLSDAYKITDKQDRQAAVGTVKSAAVEALASGDDAQWSAEDVKGELYKLEKNIVRQRIIKGEARIDGRDKTTVRGIDVGVGILPRAHGSAIFTRGETQAIVVATLGTGRDAQMIDAIEGERKEPFMLHYNFPPFCVGETGFVGSPKRREIGHGKLARRGIEAVMPNMAEFGYVIRQDHEVDGDPVDVEFLVIELRHCESKRRQEYSDPIGRVAERTSGSACRCAEVEESRTVASPAPRGS